MPFSLFVFFFHFLYLNAEFLVYLKLPEFYPVYVIISITLHPSISLAKGILPSQWRIDVCASITTLLASCLVVVVVVF